MLPDRPDVGLDLRDSGTSVGEQPRRLSITEKMDLLERRALGNDSKPADQEKDPPPSSPEDRTAFEQGGDHADPERQRIHAKLDTMERKRNAPNDGVSSSPAETFGSLIEHNPQHSSSDRAAGWIPPDARRPADRLEPRLADIYEASLRTPAGRAFYATDDIRMRNEAYIVRPDPSMYTADLHGTPHSFRVAEQDLTSNDLCELIRADEEWNGEPIRLVSCRTARGEHPVAKEVADNLGVPVVAPTVRVANDSKGDLILVAESVKRFGWRSTVDTGTWITFLPDNK